MTLDDLEVGPQAMQLIHSLGAETLDELLALPKITASQRIIAELTAAFEELGVHYKGQLVALPGPEVHVLPSHATMDERVSAICEWLAKHAPRVPCWQSPAKRAAIAKAEKATRPALD